MGGRGGNSGKYSGLSVDSLTRMQSHYQSIMNRNRNAMGLDKNSKSSVVRRKQAAAERAYNSAFSEVKEIDKALEKARKRKRNIPF